MKDLLFGKGIKGTLFRILLILTLLTTPFWYHYRFIYVDGGSMAPTYQDGQWTLMQRTRSLESDWQPERFDVIVVWSKKFKEKLCKRVIGLPGETVKVIQGKIYINGRELADSFGNGKMDIPAMTIAPDHVWVIGDSREDSCFGHFQIKNIKGKIVLY